MDVDGLETSILRGARKTLAGDALKSLIMEFKTGSPEFEEAVELLGSYGFEIAGSEATVPGRETMRNYVFARK